MRTTLALLALVAAGAVDGDGPAAADRAFAARAAEVGVNAAFLEVLSEDGTLFRPQPVAGRAWMEANADDGLLAWEPRVEWLSAAGDLGVTLGPWTYSKDAQALGGGHFLSVWTRVEGAWRLAGDIGVAHAPPSEPVEHAALALDSAPARDVAPEAARAELREAEAALGAAEDGSGPLVLLDRAHERVVVLRPGAAPACGPEAAVGLLEGGGAPARAELERVLVARSADLAATWGVLAPAAEGGARGGWLRVWRRDAGEGWRVLADVRLSAP